MDPVRQRAINQARPKSNAVQSDQIYHLWANNTAGACHSAMESDRQVRRKKITKPIKKYNFLFSAVGVLVAANAQYSAGISRTAAVEIM